MSRRADTIRSWFAALLIAAILSGAPVFAQATGMTMSGAIRGSGLAGGGWGVGGARGFHGSPGFRGRFGDRFRGGRRFHGEFNQGGELFAAPLWYPGWYDDWDAWDEGPYYYEPPAVAAPPVQTVVMTSPPAPQPERIPSNPKLVEIPGAKSAPPNRVPPAVFVLNSGEHLQSQQYLLTADELQITTNRRVRTIPLSDVDLPATLAANRERGIDLRVPAGGSEISLGF